jgi:hypothetical protein
LGVDRSRRLKSFPISLSIPWGLWVGPLPGYVRTGDLGGSASTQQYADALLSRIRND